MKRLLKKLIVLLTAFTLVLGTSAVYVNAATDPYLLGQKWSKTALKYYIDSTSSAPDVIDEDNYLFWKTSIESAFNMWDTLMEAYSINLTFTETSTKSSADIIVRYATSSSLAHVNNTISGTTITKSNLVIDDFQMIQDGYSDDYLYDVVMHEIGHTIGLAQITEAQAKSASITSVMVETPDSPYFENYPTYAFDRLNIKKMY